MTDFADRVDRIAREVMESLGRSPEEIDDVIEPAGAEYCLINFEDESIQPIEIPKGLGAGDSQEVDEIRRALQYRFRT